MNLIVLSDLKQCCRLVSEIGLIVDENDRYSSVAIDQLNRFLFL
jgi:hypothetical protein